MLPGIENDDDAVTLDEDEDGGVGRHLDRQVMPDRFAVWHEITGATTTAAA